MKIEEVRKKKGKTRAEVSRAAGVPYNTMWRYERKGRIPDVITAARIAKGLGCKVEELLTPEERKPAS